jgi:probable rRNA maturation factor
MRAFADQLRDQVADGRPFTCLITDDRELERLNRMFLGKEYPTDVLSFPSSGPGILGEIAISVQRAREQAEDHGHDTADEIRILMLHGVLHLLGMDHERDRGSMARAEKRWREAFGLPVGLIERSRYRRK